jgi:hypothetical protein
MTCIKAPRNDVLMSSTSPFWKLMSLPKRHCEARLQTPNNYLTSRADLECHCEARLRTLNNNETFRAEAIFSYGN